MDEEITPDTTIEELVRVLPRAVVVLRSFGLVCVQCGEPVWGTLRELAASKGIGDLEPILVALRQATLSPS